MLVLVLSEWISFVLGFSCLFGASAVYLVSFYCLLCGLILLCQWKWCSLALDQVSSIERPCDQVGVSRLGEVFLVQGTSMQILPQSVSAL